MFTNILIPLDGTSFAEAEIHHALELLKGVERARLILTMAISGPAIPAVPPLLVNFDQIQTAADRERLQCTVYLQKLMADIKTRRPELTLGYRLAMGTPHQVITQVAREEAVDLVIMASHGRSGLERLLSGSITESVVRELETAVLVVHPEKAEPGQRSPSFAAAVRDSERAD
ncbi:MAG: universal stress protein [Vulcanimicrobiota bacterium]